MSAATFTVTQVSPLTPRSPVGHAHESIVDIAVSGDTSSGGDSLTAARLGFTKVLFFSAMLDLTSGTAGFIPHYDITNAKLQFFKANGTTNLIDASTAPVTGTFRAKVTGI